MFFLSIGWRRIQRELEYLHNKPTNVGDNNQVNGSKMVDTANTTFVKIKHINSSTSSSIPSKLAIVVYPLWINWLCFYLQRILSLSIWNHFLVNVSFRNCCNHHRRKEIFFFRSVQWHTDVYTIFESVLVIIFSPLK